MNAEQPDYSKLPKQFQLGLKAGADIRDGRQSVAYLIDLVNFLNGRLIEEVEERTRLQKRNQTCEECCAEWAELSQKQLDRIEELTKEVERLKEEIWEGTGICSKCEKPLYDILQKAGTENCSCKD